MACDGRSRGQRNYEGYCRKAGGVSLVSGDSLPAWDALHPDIQAAWEAGAEEVVTGREHSWSGPVEYRDGG